MLTADDLIKKFNMKLLPGEGGYYCETHRSDHILPESSLSENYNSERSLSTSIYYMHTPNTKSLLHRLPTEEIYHYYLGDPVFMLLLFPDGKIEQVILGHDLENDHTVQLTVPKNVWQGSFLLSGGKYALMGTTMAPGFDFADNEIGQADELLKLYPSVEELILNLTN